MRVVPSVVIGLGSSGAYVIENLERILYEVLGDARIDLFQFFAIDTDTQRKEDAAPPGGRRSQTISAYERDLGRAIRDLTHILRDDFRWCPQDLRIPGPGAGNIRAGGRAMWFNKFPELWNLIRTAVSRVGNEAALPRSEEQLQALLNRRGLMVPPPIVNPNESVVYVVGTLGGGTCSGMCVDLGYAIKDAAPHVNRVGLFFVPDRTVGPVFLSNTWAALRDLEYFCDNPQAFKAVWPSAHRAAHYYNGGDAHPYEQVYLVSPQDEGRQQRLIYQANSNSPLVVMMAMRLALDLLGGYEPRMAKIADMNNHVGGPPKRRMFLNFNLRAVSFPKYEISEAAACRYVADTICTNWLDEAQYQGLSGKTPMKKETIQEAGRNRWNEQLPSIWQGIRATVNTNHWIDQLMQGDLAKPYDELVHQFAGDVQGTVFSHIGQQLSSRAEELKRMIKEGLVAEISPTRNLKYADYYIDGVVSELNHTLRYWDKLKIPTKRDHAAWTTTCREAVNRLLHHHASWSSRSVGARRDLVREQLEEILTRLEMYLMRSILAEIAAWIDTDIRRWLTAVRSAINSVKTLAKTREDAITAHLKDESGPVLKLSRSTKEGFPEEIRSLAERPIEVRATYLRLNQDGNFEGLLAIEGNTQRAEDQVLFLELKNLVQPELLRRLEEKGPVDIVREIQAQQRIHQAIIRRQETRALSIATDPGLSKDHTAVPAMVFAKDVATAQNLDQALRVQNPDLPSMDAKGLPIFDHMVIFYQEGAGFEPDTLLDKEFFERAYQGKMSERPDYIDPLRLLKSTQITAALGGHL